MGYPDGYYYGQGRIICDTSTFSVGDTIRVRSMTDSSKVWNQQVATVGTALVFTVPCYDYYKICTVQTINDTPTEIGGVYKTVDYGQTLYINVLDNKSLAWYQSVLNSHNENYVCNIGDEAIIKINDGGTPKDWTVQIGRIDGTNHAIDFVSLKLYTNSAFSSGRSTPYSSSILRPVVQSFYNLIDSNDKQYIKEVTRSCITNDNSFSTYSDYIWIPDKTEVTGTVPGSTTPPVPRNGQFPLFSTQANRIRTRQDGNASAWWLSDSTYGDSYYTDVVNSQGTYKQDGNRQDTNEYALPCFRLTADS